MKIMKCFEQRATIEGKVEMIAKNIESQAEFFDTIAFKELEKAYNDILEDLDDRRLQK